MAISVILVCLWVVAASVAGTLPKRLHWPCAWGLIVTGIPLLGFITLQAGPVWGLLAMAGGASILRWPLRRFGGWMHRAVSRRSGGPGPDRARRDRNGQNRNGQNRTRRP